MSVRLSAGGAGVRPFSSSLARMKASMGLRNHFRFLGCGTARRWGVRNDHHKALVSSARAGAGATEVSARTETADNENKATRTGEDKNACLLLAIVPSQ